MSRRSQSPGGALLRCIVAWSVAAAVAAPGVLPEASAQSAADKATARQLATGGIKLYRAGKYAESLDKMQRAQALYGAPIHLLYIARDQEKLNLLVESAETYRNLVRTKLSATSPKVFVDAVEDGRTELAELEPRLPSLRIDVEPARVSGLEILLDGNKVSAAIVGVDRPANPGEHTIRVAAPGFRPVQKKVKLAEKQRLAAPFQLQPDEGGGVIGPAPGPVQTPPQPDATADRQPASVRPPRVKKKPGLLGFMVGLRVGGAVPTGGLMKVGNTETPMSDVFKPGGGGELHAGIRIARYFTPVVFAEGYVLGPGPQFDEDTPPADVEVTTRGQYTGAGIGLLAGTPRGELGGFGEVGLSLVHRFSVQEEGSGIGRSCTSEQEFTGTGVRIGGGGTIPIGGDLFHLTPFVNLTLSSISKADGTLSGSAGDCGAIFPGFDPVKGEVPSDEQATHTVVTIGVGGDFHFGGDSAN